uniref:Uncharacterized protein n=1 Tax=Cacopsylla melanoneura TaxID=428564 RepID=A0A8D8U0C5_9HEMI
MIISLGYSEVVVRVTNLEKEKLKFKKKKNQFNHITGIIKKGPLIQIHRQRVYRVFHLDLLITCLDKSLFLFLKKYLGAFWRYFELAIRKYKNCPRCFQSSFFSNIMVVNFIHFTVFLSI